MADTERIGFYRHDQGKGAVPLMRWSAGTRAISVGDVLPTLREELSSAALPKARVHNVIDIVIEQVQNTLDHQNGDEIGECVFTVTSRDEDVLIKTEGTINRAQLTKLRLVVRRVRGYTHDELQSLIFKRISGEPTQQNPGIGLATMQARSRKPMELVSEPCGEGLRKFSITCFA